MKEWLQHFALSFIDTGWDILPVVVMIMVFQWLVIQKPLPNLTKTLIGFIYVILGVSFFMEGLHMALFPLGQLMATQLTAPAFIGVANGTMSAPWQAYYWVYIFAASIGFASTLAEPSLHAVTLKAEQLSAGAISARGLRITVSLGVAFGIALGVFRIVTGLSIYYFIITGYIIVMLQTLYTPKRIIGLAYDAGGVTTSTVTVPLVLALGFGIASNIPGRNPLIDSFGLIAFASLFSIIAVLLYAQLAAWWSKRQTSSKY
ncbi:MAG: DUF1538 domain-containing protein [Methylococcales bacterium]|jgi:hypothetical protein|nr:DUF1538 domain-containing protein [Methylococcales bacterium]